MVHSDFIDQLAEAITRAWTKCGLALKPYMEGNDEAQKEGRYILVLVEFFYFFIHVVRRYALIILGREGEKELMKKLQPVMVDYAVSICFSQFDEDYRRHISQRLPAGIEERDKYYSEGDYLPPEKANQSERPWIITLLISHVIRQSVSPTNEPQIINEAMKVTLNQVFLLDPEKRITAIKHN